MASTLSSNSEASLGHLDTYKGRNKTLVTIFSDVHYRDFDVKGFMPGTMKAISGLLFHLYPENTHR